MRRALLSSTLCLAYAASATSAAAATTTPPPRAALQAFVCQRASTSLDRAVGVTAVMRPMSGTQQMEMRFVLLQRAAGSTTFTRVRGGDLGRWLHPKSPTLGQQPSDVWRLKKLVVNLAAPSDYWFRVTFRWLGASSTTVGQTILMSATCDQPG